MKKYEIYGLVVVLLFLSACGGSGDSDEDNGGDRGSSGGKKQFWNHATKLPTRNRSGYVDLLFNGNSYVVASSDHQVFSGRTLVSLASHSLPLESPESIRDGLVGGQNNFYITFGGSSQNNVTGILASEDAVNWSTIPLDMPYVGDTINCAAYSTLNNQIAALGSMSDSNIGTTFGAPENITFMASDEIWHLSSNVKDGELFYCEKMLDAGSRWVAIGSQGGVHWPVVDLVWLSDDGLNWSPVLESSGGTYLSSITKSSNMLVAVGRNILKESSATRNYLGLIYFSTDGIAWSTVSDPEEEISNLHTVASNGQGFLAIGSAQSGFIITYASTDGISWQAVDTRAPESLANTGLPIKLIWDGSRYVLLMGTGDILVHTPSASGIDDSMDMGEDPDSNPANGDTNSVPMLIEEVEVLHAGSYSLHQSSITTIELVNDQDSYHRLLQSTYGNTNNAIDIDFSQNTIVFVSMGEDSTGGVYVAIDEENSISDGSGVLLHLDLTQLGMNCVITGSYTYPFSFILVPTDKPVTVIEETVITDC